jgi:hypothetical protein
VSRCRGKQGGQRQAASSCARVFMRLGTCRALKLTIIVIIIIIIIIIIVITIIIIIIIIITIIPPRSNRQVGAPQHPPL